MLWKLLLTHLDSATVALPTESRNVFFQLIGFIMERVEFHLPLYPLDVPSTKIKTPKASSNPNVGSLAYSPTVSSKDRREGHAKGLQAAATNEAHTSKSLDLHDDATDQDRDSYLYRRLLIATFKYATTNLDAVRRKQRSYISLVETRFYARIFAVCFFRVPVLQCAMLEQILHAYHEKQWLPVHHPASRVFEDSTSDVQASPSHLWHGHTFATCLSRWTDYNGACLDNEPMDQSTTKTARVYRQYTTHVSTRCSEETEFVRQNPTLFQWTRFSPYLGEDPDSEILHPKDLARTSWLSKLSHDGEFFSKFMGFVCLHAANTATTSNVVWTSLPGYTLLIRVSLLLLKEACWAKWLYVRDTCGPLPSSSMEMEPKHPDEPRVPFELESIRAIRTVLDNVVQLLRNHELLATCIVAMYECTNVLHARSVEVCLTRFEEWFSATAILTELGSVDKRRMGSGMLVYRLPRTFQGQAFATGIRVMLSSENCEILNSTLLFLYHRMDYFDGDLRQSILKTVVQRHMTFFLHWNVDVRTKYHHLLVYRLVRANRFVLDSPIDHLLLGNDALASHETHHDSKNPVKHDPHHPSNPRLTTTDLQLLGTEQALWRAFDACLAVIIHTERHSARENNHKFHQEQVAVRNRAQAFQTLKIPSPQDDRANAVPMPSINESLPGGNATHEIEALDQELHREVPNYLRYLPSDEVAMLDELRRLAASVKYAVSSQVYAIHSLRNYTDLLKHYYHTLDTTGSVEPPPLGFFEL